jgi:hypothetical protein
VAAHLAVLDLRRMVLDYVPDWSAATRMGLPEGTTGRLRGQRFHEESARTGGKLVNLDDLHARNVAEVNAWLVVQGRCYMHNSDLFVPAVAVMRLAIGNEVPLCQPCLDWWIADSEAEKGIVVNIRQTSTGDQSCISPPTGKEINL